MPAIFVEHFAYLLNSYFILSKVKLLLSLYAPVFPRVVDHLAHTIMIIFIAAYHALIEFLPGVVVIVLNRKRRRRIDGLEHNLLQRTGGREELVAGLLLHRLTLSHRPTIAGPVFLRNGGRLRIILIYSHVKRRRDEGRSKIYVELLLLEKLPV